MALLRVCTQRDAALGTSETLVWRIAGQVMCGCVFYCLSRARFWSFVSAFCSCCEPSNFFFNKHGFANLDINRENIVLQTVHGNDKLMSIS